ncbi:MAG: DinB family protein [Phycisphaeraceae bacterium]|nr:DinB family protein [Phycisphaeraceae bacterium]
MEPMRTYHYLCRARSQVFDWVRPLDCEKWTREFPIGLGTLGRTLTHICICEWYYIARMKGEVVPPYAQWPIHDEAPPPFSELEPVWLRQAEATKAVLAATQDWPCPVTYAVTTDAGQRLDVSASKQDIFTQLVLHEVHHRAQAMNMLRQLGVALRDIDYNELMYSRRPASSAR